MKLSISIKRIFQQTKFQTPFQENLRTQASKNAYLLKVVILPLLARPAWKRLQIDVNFRFAVTRTTDGLSRGINIDNLKRLWICNIESFSNFFDYSESKGALPSPFPGFYAPWNEQSWRGMLMSSIQWGGYPRPNDVCCSCWEQIHDRRATEP